ncbi:hypothetical protein GCM10020221_34150 [Streptomyces thioluteus]|uniref:Uncharacterized protein n=1 Tax=Streptomyces thioluteus TaxID=66431 RepID=A0ABN3X2N2_STRTU
MAATARNSGSADGERKKQDLKDVPPPPPAPLPCPSPTRHTHLDMQGTSVEDGPGRGRRRRRDHGDPGGCDLAGSRWAAETAAAHANVWATVALHPNEAPRIVLGDPDGWSRQGAREPGGMPALDEALAEIDALGRAGGGARRGRDRPRLLSVPGRRAWRPRSTPSAGTSTSPSGTARPWSSTTGTPTTTCCGLLAEEGAPETVVFHCFLR